MSHRSNVTRLLDWATRSIVANLGRHSRAFQQHAHQKEIGFYKPVQFLFTDKVIEQLEHFYYLGQINDDEVKKLAEFLFEDKNISVFDVEYMLRFLFNEFKTDSYPLLRKKSNVSYQLLSILSQCVDLRILEVSSASFKGTWFTEFLATWSQLRTVKLVKVESSDEIVNAIFLSCPALHTLWVEGEAITNESMFRLCGNQLERSSNFPGCSAKSRYHVVEGKLVLYIRSTASNYTLCENNTNCCTFARKLTKLTIKRTSITVDGIACLLEHCHSLVEIEEPFITEENAFHGSVVDAVLLLRDCMMANQKLNFKLKLNTLKFKHYFCSRAMQDTTECCPSLKYIKLCFWKPEATEYNAGVFPSMKVTFKADPQTDAVVHNLGYFEFLTAKGHQVHELITEANSEFTFLLRDLHSAVKRCINMNYLVLKTFNVWDWDEEFDVPPFVNNVEKLAFVDLQIEKLSSQRYFVRILSNAQNVRFLVVSRWLAEVALMEALKHNNFASLETLVLYRADLARISLLSLISPRKKLACITHVQCKNVPEFIHRHEGPLRKCGLRVENEESLIL